jgi:hypothetical protein
MNIARAPAGVKSGKPRFSDANAGGLGPPVPARLIDMTGYFE